VLRFFVIIALFLTFCFTALFGQDAKTVQSDSITKINGKKYLIHTVLQGQTLFSIAKVYEVKLSSIAFDNAGVLSGIQPGHHLKIRKRLMGESVREEPRQKPLAVAGEFILYEVSAKQTLYAISKEYNTTVTAILAANTSLVDGLKVGTTIRIPVPKLLDSNDPQTVRMVGLPAMDLLTSKDEKKEPQVVLMLPLYLSINDALEAHRQEGEPENIYKRSEIALHFYEGFLLAADTLAKLGYKINVKILDTENSPKKVQQLIKKGELNGADFIIGPFYSKVFAKVAAFGQRYCIPVVSSTIKSDNIINNNPYVFKMIASEESMLFEMGRYLAKSDSTNNMILHFGSEKELGWVRKFKQGLKENSLQPPHFQIFNVWETGRDSVRQQLSLFEHNNVVVLSNNQVKLSTLVRKLSDWTEDAHIVTFAPNVWTSSRSLSVHHFDRLHLHIPMPFFIDYKNLATQVFVKKFRNRFRAEPSTFAFRGYDLAMHFLQNIDGLKSDGAEYMLRVSNQGLQSNLGWKKLKEGGYQNYRTHIVDYTDLNLKKAVD